MTYDEAIEKMAAELFGDLAKSECYEVARAQAEAIGLRETMEDAKVGREIRTNPKAFIAYRPVRSSGP